MGRQSQRAHPDPSKPRLAPDPMPRSRALTAALAGEEAGEEDCSDSGDQREEDEEGEESADATKASPGGDNQGAESREASSEGQREARDRCVQTTAPLAQGRRRWPIQPLCLVAGS